MVALTHYSLKSDGDSVGHLVQWTVSGSNDEHSWTVIDRQNTQDLNGPFVTKLFECDERSVVPKFYRYIRLTQTGKTSLGCDSLGERRALGFSRDDRPIKKLTSNPVASPRECLSRNQA
jgi:hypothetical protein